MIDGPNRCISCEISLAGSFPAPNVPPADPSETEDCLLLNVKVPETTIRSKNVANKKRQFWSGYMEAATRVDTKLNVRQIRS